MSGFKKGDRVIWTHVRHLNSVGMTIAIKHGRYVCKVKHTYRYKGMPLAYVEVDGNKRLSKVPLYLLELETEGDENVR